MPDTVTVARLDETHDLVSSSDPGILMELSESLTFMVPGYKFMPAFRSGKWNGKASIFNPFSRRLPKGLREWLSGWCGSRDYEVVFPVEERVEFGEEDAKRFVSTLKLPKTLNGVPFEVRDYQLQAFVEAVRKRRLTLLSPTASGKSLIIYLIIRYFAEKTLVIVPNLGLVRQMKGDFVEYGMDPDLVHQIFSGQEKVTDHPVTVSTWQSLRKMSGQFLGRFGVLIVDETHGAKASELKKIVERMVDCRVRIGLSGTLHNEKLSDLTIEGLLGPIHRVTTTKRLIEEKRLADFRIRVITLRHDDEVCKLMRGGTYPDEMRYLVTSRERNDFIVRLAKSLVGNTLILYQYVENHGEPLRDLLLREVSWPVHFVAGKVDSEDRDDIRRLVNEATQSTTVASKGTFSTGTNIPNIDHIIFASPSKARIQTLQSIGRGLRRSARKKLCTLYDIGDDLSWKSHQNHTLRHLTERIRIYNQEEFEYEILRFPLRKRQ
jgi:superfamily II DNA or RNA helicase